MAMIYKTDGTVLVEKDLDFRALVLESKYILIGANLSYADLTNANLRGANLRGANLIGANLIGANLNGANLNGANLTESNLTGANLRGADLRDANLRDANLRGADLPYYQICPEEGDFIAWKRVQNQVLKLLIPKEAKRTSSLITRKCRAEFVKVLECEKPVESQNNCKYKQGELVFPDSYNDDPRVECTHGIHFFITKQEAIDYV